MPLTKTREDALVVAALVGLGAAAAVVSKKLFAAAYTPPKVWEYKPQGGKWGSTNRPTAGAQTDQTLPRGQHALQLYSLATPNGVKVTTLLEELCLRYGIEYDAYKIDIMTGDQFTSGFVSANPNSKIPALLHYEDGKEEPTRVFETAAIMMYLCEKFDKENLFLPPPGSPLRAECLSWLCWTQGSAPFLGGGFGHFYAYAPVKIRYAIDRYAMETKRQLDVLDKHLAASGPYLCGDILTIADLAAWPWYGALVLGNSYTGSDEFLQVHNYKHVVAWAKRIDERKGVKRGCKVNRSWGEKDEQLPERHSSSDFDNSEGKEE